MAKRPYIIALLLLWTASVCLFAQTDPPPAFFVSSGMETPEEVITAFVERLGQKDIDGALSLCAISEKARGEDYLKKIERLRIIQPVALHNIPQTEELFIRFKEYSEASKFLNSIVHMVLSLNTPSEFYHVVEGRVKPYDGDVTELDELLNIFTTSHFAEINIEDIQRHRLQNTAQHQEILRKRAAIWGAEEITGRGVLYEWQSDFYMGSFTLIKYDGLWLISELVDPVWINAGFLGILEPLPDKSSFYDEVQ